MTDPDRPASSPDLLAAQTALIAQAVVGLLVAITTRNDARAFDGDIADLLWHAAGGIVAVDLATTAFVRSGRDGNDQSAARESALWNGLRLLAIGSLIFTIPPNPGRRTRRAR
ncbi:MAG: hypothetical protein AAGA65_23195 [Actinomycetota bacterium]